MKTSCDSVAEKRAIKAEDHPAFNGLKLSFIKSGVAEILAQIGRDGFFSEYTRHDISHIDAMLHALEWIIPESTAAILTDADWMLIVLSIYFHDLGMVVTKEEYERRDESDFHDFCRKELFAGDAGLDYKSKVESLGGENEVNRFLYQEYVRYQHGKRVRDWIEGGELHASGPCKVMVEEIDRILSSADPQLRQDLGLICESHHLDDLADTGKYKLARPYGNSDNEVANLQFAAIVLRTSDLLHITRDRTPAIAFRLIDPSDPISQEEWSKQSAVKSVRPKDLVESEERGEVIQDTIQIHAYFVKPDGFFGLTSYISYAEDQLGQNFSWLRKSNQRTKKGYLLPWKAIDDSTIETKGFLKESFEFQLDNQRILDLLTGHTLYNDSSVVLREVVQNAIDAVRVQEIISDREQEPSYRGKVNIDWCANSRWLRVVDNGTGMTQEIIESNLLRVGASRYQSKEFGREFPDFSSISRFGIGILSAFMVADEVEVMTCHPEEECVRAISLRSVHGRYLIRLIEKKSNDVPAEIKPHGTQLSIRLRPSVGSPDILKQARKWFVVPQCEIEVTIGETTERIGHESAKAALTDSIRQAGRSSSDIIIVEKKRGGVDLAFAVRWSDVFRVYSFMPMNTGLVRRLSTNPSGVCIEGIRVESRSPGFDQNHIVALANATGHEAPRTNVARSGLELTPERERLFVNIFEMYCEHICDEMKRLRSEFSLSWSIREGRLLFDSLVAADTDSVEGAILQAVRNLPVFLVEEDGHRKAMSGRELSAAEEFWTIHGAFYTSAEHLIREVESNASLSTVVSSLDVPGLRLPSGISLCSRIGDTVLDNDTLRHHEIDLIKVDKRVRRMDFRWIRRREQESGWLFLTEEDVREVLMYLGSYRTVSGRMMVSDLELIRVEPVDSALALRGGVLVGAGVQVEGLDDEAAVKDGQSIYVLPGSEIGDILQQWLVRCRDDRCRENLAVALVALSYLQAALNSPTRAPEKTFAGALEAFGVPSVPPEFPTSEFCRACRTMKYFDCHAWSRGAGE